MKPRRNRAGVCALGLLGSLMVVSYAEACNLCGTMTPDVHLLPAAPGEELLQPISQDGSPPTFPLNVPALNSRPTASAKLYLDFDGDVTPSWGVYAPGTTPAYSTDADATTFTQAELNNIQEMWQRVSEAYSPFNINVTTVDPGTYLDRVTMRVVVGGDGKNDGVNYWPGVRAGGIGYVGGYISNLPNTAFVFPGNLAAGHPTFTAMSIAHEAGHGFSLWHQSEFIDGIKVQEYSDNDPTTTGSPQEWETPEQRAAHYSAQPSAPFMGYPYKAGRAIWTFGNSTAANVFQYDSENIANTNGFGFYNDESGTGPESASELQIIGDALLAAGVITTPEDHDFYSFSTLVDSHYTFTVWNAPYGGMLDASLAMYDSEGELVKLAATSSLVEYITVFLTAGTYTLDVFSAGNFGDIGQYTLNGAIGMVPEPGAGLLLAFLIPLMARGRRE